MRGPTLTGAAAAAAAAEMEGRGDEERMQEVAPDLNGTLEDNDIDDEEQQQQQDAAEDDEPQHGDEHEHHNNGYQNGGSKDDMVESDPKDSPHGSQGKASGSGLVVSGPSSIALVRVLPLVLEMQLASVLWLGFRRGLHVGG